ncbi:potassium voltage-gated channel protein Shaw-like [Mercenaria mercenaria]|uniref:potassium voltage-gated channel protein Shaw-like n=1 Tax=Mercenaria mercenaria TaxID=6596 RepID=UPI00234F6F2F|nr:potassium voltage-gated channel protein Shaw-like [Mercenaria mercenaria]
MVVPILLYGAEIWGVYNFKGVDNLHLKFCKYLLDAKKQTPNNAVYEMSGSENEVAGTEEVRNNNHTVEKNQVKEDVVTINVSGMTFELDVDDIRRAPSSRLHKYVFNGKRSMCFKRPVQSFEAILAYYQTGDLHMPLSVCPGAFRTELEFWGLDPQIMTKCCYYRYLSFEDDQETLDKFHLHLFPTVGVEKEKHKFLPGIRKKLWNILDFQDKAMVTKIYFWICTLMVILSVLTLALSSLPYFRRNLTKCEMEEALGRPLQSVSYEVPKNDSCAEPLPDEIFKTIVVEYERVNVTNRTELQENDILLNADEIRQEELANANKSDGSKDSRSFFDFGFDGDDTVSDEVLLSHIFEALRPQVGIGKKTVRIQAIVYLDTIVLGFFTADLLLRIFCCPSVSGYFLSTINIIDALVVLSAYAHMTINLLKKNEKYEFSNFDILEIFQVLRVVRLLRIVRDVIGFKVLSFSMKVSLKDLLVLFLYLILGVIIFANFIFFVESAEDIESVPVGWWWAISTLTTVGYGDVVPRSLYGRLIGGICAVSGLVMMAVAIPVFVNTFLLVYAYAVLYKKSLHKPEDTHRFIHRQGKLRNKTSPETGNGHVSNIGLY